LYAHARIDLHDAKENTCRQQGQVEHRQEKNRIWLPLLQGVENRPGPDVHAIGSGKIEKDS
jgi:hypothetical protein